MAGSKNKTKHLLKIERDCERSRLEGQLLASAYELLTPTLRRALPTASSQPNRPEAAQRTRQQVGGNRA